MQLSPGEIYTIFRGIEDHTDTGTYYVQAVIKDSRTKTTLATVNLTDNGDRTFSNDWRVTTDKGGLGTYINICISVYTDSGYTTKSPNYGDKYEDHLIQQRESLGFGFGGGGGTFSYKRIEEIVQKAIEGRKIPTFPVPKEIDLKPVLKSLTDLKDKISAIVIPEPEKVDLMPIIKRLEDVKTAVLSIEIPETDLSPLIAKVDVLESKLPAEWLQETKTALDGLFERIKRFFDTDIEAIKTDTQKINDRFDKIITLINGEKE